MKKSLIIKYGLCMGVVILAGFLIIARPLLQVKEAIKESQPVLAIVIDDFGGADTRGVEDFMSMDRPITMAVMPNLIHSREQSELAFKKGHEVILHQPMEPVRGKASWLGPGAIFVNMDAEEIKRVFIENLETVPHAKGFNNHTGSKVTSLKEKIKPLLEVAGQKELFVLDSRTSPDSQVIPVAKSMNIPCVTRDIFLDDYKSESFIRKQLLKACKIAKQRGYAIAIGHVGQGGNVTAKTVKDCLPLLEKEGVKIVPLSQIVHLSNQREKI